MTATDHPNRERLDRLFRDDEFAGAIGAELTDWGGGTAEVVWTPRPEHRNFTGIAHGGAIFAAGDVGFAVASNSWGRVAVALTVDTHFLAAPEIGTEVRAVARERARTRRTGSYLIELTQDDREIASLHAMVFRTGRWHFGAEEWPEDWRDAH